MPTQTDAHEGQGSMSNVPSSSTSLTVEAPSEAIAVAQTASPPNQRAAQGGIAWGPFAIIVIELVLLGVVIRQFSIESGAFARLTALAFVGFGINALLPLAWRLP